MGYTLPQIAEILAKADRTMYRIGSIAYDDMFNELDESLDYNRDVIYVYKKSVEYADDYYVGTDKLNSVVERLGAKIAVYDYGQLTPIYSDSTITIQSVPVGAALDDLSDVTITNVQNNQTLRYSSSLGQWINVGPGAAVRNRQQFTATLNQTVFVTTFQFESGLLDVYLNGVKLSPPSYTTFGNYTITLADGSLADDIIEIIAYDTATSFIDLSGYVPTSRTLTINGVTYDLSANRTWTIDSLPSQAGNTGKYLTTDGVVASWGTVNLIGYVPYTGATGDVNLGEYGLTAGQITLDLSPTGTAAVGTTRWNDSLGSSETTLKGGTVVLKNGVDLVARVVNKVTPNTTLTKSNYQAVRVSGAQGQRLAVAFAQANSDLNSADTIGLITETIPTNQEGFIITMGQIEEINTTGSLQGETWVDGDVLYLSPFTPGAITKVKPTGNGHIVVIGYVEYAHAVHGKIYVKIMNGWELDELHDVDIVNPANNEALIYESSTSLWKNKTIAAALGYTPVPTTRTIGTTSPLVGGGDLSADRTLSIPAATTSVNGYLTSTDWTTFNNKVPSTRTLTINGTAYDLSADRSWTVSGSMAIGGAITSATAGSVLFAGTSGVLSQDNSNLFWDDTNNRLGIGVATPLIGLDVSTGGRMAGVIITGNPSIPAGTGAALTEGYYAAGGYAFFQGYNYSSNTYIPVYVDGSFTALNPNSGGNVAVGTTSNLGYKFHVNGTTFLNGNVTFGTISSGVSGMFWDNTYNRLGIGTSSPANIFVASKNQNSASVINVSNTTSGTFAVSLFNATSDSSSGTLSIGKHSSTTTANKIISSKDALMYNSVDGDIAILNDVATGKIKLAAGGSSTAQMTLTNAGRILLGTTTESTYLLDVNGTARVSQALLVSGLINTSAGNGISAGGNSFAIAPSSTRGVINVNGSTDQFVTFSTQSYLYNSSSLFRMLSTSDIDFVAGGSQRLLISSSTGASTFSSSVTASSFIKSGGTSSQYLMADGSVTTGGGGSVDEQQVSLICQVFG